MSRKGFDGRALKRSLLLGIFLAVGTALVTVDADDVGAAEQSANAKASEKPSAGRERRSIVVAIPLIDSARGAQLFVNKGCVICHSINGVGGKAGPALDAAAGNEIVDIFDFAARMWAGSFAMIELQGMELGYQLEINGEELGHIAAFVYDRRAQKRFSESDVPDLIKDMIIREPYEPGKGLDDPREKP